MIDWIKTVKGIAAIMAAIFATMSLGGTSACLPRVLARAGTGSPPDRGCSSQSTGTTRLLVVDQTLLANPLGMLWPEMDVTFVS
jgi:hypothetical protein